MKRIYTKEADSLLAGKMMICDMFMAGNCDVKECGGHGAKPHIYETEECFGECCWDGKTGPCVPVDKIDGLDKYIDTYTP